MDKVVANIVELKSVTLTLGSKLILNQVDLSIPANKITLLMGMSGAGKTSILRMITGQVKPNKGGVFIDGDQLNCHNLKHLYRVRKQIGMVFQSGALFSDLTVAENVMLPLKEHSSLTSQEMTELVDIALHAVDLNGENNLYPWELSGGMVKRVALARASVLNPKIMLYDEPLAGQDPLTCAKLVKLIKAKSVNNSTIIVSHNLGVMLKLVDYVVMLDAGRLLFADFTDQLKSCNDPLVKSFVRNYDF